MTRHTNSSENSRNIYTEVARYYIYWEYIMWPCGLDLTHSKRPLRWAVKGRASAELTLWHFLTTPYPQKKPGCVDDLADRAPDIHSVVTQLIAYRVPIRYTSHRILTSVICALVNWDYVCCVVNAHGIGEEQEGTRRRMRSENCLPVPNYKKMESIYQDEEGELGKDKLASEWRKRNGK